MTSYGWVRYVEVRRGGHGPIRSVKFWCTSVRHGHGEAVLIRCVRVRFDRVRTRCGGHVKVRYVVFREGSVGLFRSGGPVQLSRGLLRSVKAGRGKLGQGGQGEARHVMSGYGVLR